MINKYEVYETNQMIAEENLDVRTITLGISLLDCIDADLDKLNENIYNKITTVAKDLVKTGEEIEQEFGIPIVNKRISITPVALIGGAACKSPEDFVTIAKTLDKAAKEVGVNFIGGYSALAMKENTLGVKMSMAGIQADADSPAAENAVQKTYPGSEVVMENPGVEPLARRCYPDAYSMLGALRLAAPHTEFLYAQGYPYAGNEESGHDAALQIAKDADLVICTLGGHYGWNASCTTGEGIDAMHIGLPVCQERFLEKLESLHKPVVGVHFDGHAARDDAFGNEFLAIFTNDPAVAAAGMHRIMIMGFSYMVSAFMDCTIAASRGIGKSFIPTVIVILGSCVFRVIWVYTIFAHFHTIPSLYLLYIFSWTITSIAEIAYFVACYRARLRSVAVIR